MSQQHRKKKWHIVAMVQSAVVIEYTDCISAEGLDFSNLCPGYDTKQSSNAGTLRNTEYFYIAIAPGSILSPEL